MNISRTTFIEVEENVIIWTIYLYTRYIGKPLETTHTTMTNVLTCNVYLGVKPVIHKSELRTYANVVPFNEKSYFRFVVLWKNTEWNGIIRIDNWS